VLYVAASFPVSEGDIRSVSKTKTWNIWDAVGGYMLCNDLQEIWVGEWLHHLSCSQIRIVYLKMCLSRTGLLHI